MIRVNGVGLRVWGFLERQIGICRVGWKCRFDLVVQYNIWGA